MKTLYYTNNGPPQVHISSFLFLTTALRENLESPGLIWTRLEPLNKKHSKWFKIIGSVITDSEDTWGVLQLCFDWVNIFFSDPSEKRQREAGSRICSAQADVALHIKVWGILGLRLCCLDSFKLILYRNFAHGNIAFYCQAEVPGAGCLENEAPMLQGQHLLPVSLKA